MGRSDLKTNSPCQGEVVRIEFIARGDLEHMPEEGHTVTRAQFEANLAQKRKQPDFRDDVGPLLRPGFTWDFEAAMDAVLKNIVAPLPGDPWRSAPG